MQFPTEPALLGFMPFHLLKEKENIIEAILPNYDAYVLNQVMYITHKGASLEFRTDKIIRVRLYEADKNLLYHLNWYWSGLTENEQDRIFNVYAQIHQILMKTPDTTYENLQLGQAINRLVNLHRIDKLTKWITLPGVVLWPNDKEIPRGFDSTVQAKHTRDKTYTYEDYQDLMAFVLQLRVLTPIWGEFLHQHDKIISRSFRDMIALQLAGDSNLHEGIGYKKLDAYVAAMVASKASKSTSGSMEFLSSEDYTIWLFSNLVIRRLSTASFYPPPEDHSAFLVKVISNHVKDRIEKSENEFSTPTFKKDTIDNSRNEESQHSTFENYRGRQALSGGDRYFLQWYTQGLERLARELEPDIDPKLVGHFMNMYPVGDFIPTEPQVLLLQWVMAPVLSPRAVPDLTRINIAQSLAVAGAVLWHRKHFIISAFITARHTKASLDASISGESVSRMSNVTYEVLPKLFPYQRRQKATEKSYKGITDTVKELVHEISQLAWQPTLPNVYLKEISDYVTGTASNKTLIVPSNMRPLMMEMIIDLAGRPLDKYISLSEVEAVPSLTSM